MTAGWQTPARQPKCSHMGAAIVSMVGMLGREPGDVWLCVCGKRYVVRLETHNGQRVKVLRAE